MENQTKNKKPKNAWNSGYFSRLGGLSQKAQIKLFLKALIIIISTAGFIYQTEQLLNVYMSGKTSVDNRVESVKHSELPAITICLPTFLSMDRFAEHILKDSKDPTYTEVYEKYQEFKSSFSTWNNQARSDQDEIFERMVNEIFPNTNISIGDIFTEIIAPTENMTLWEGLAFNESEEMVDLEPPRFFESMVPFSDPRKCLTLFSDFDPNYSDKKFDLILLFMKFTHDNDTFPLSQYTVGDFYVALHSANILPNYIREESFKKLEMGKVNAISYQATHTRRLPAPFDTNCKVYRLDEEGSHNMRSDCIQKCIDKRLNQLFPEINCLFTKNNYKLIRRENLFKLSGYQLCNYFLFNETFVNHLVRKQFIEENTCKKSCLRNCDDTFYDFTVEAIKGDEHSWVNRSDEFGLTLEHNRFPDQIINHMPIMRWIDFMSSFGGLLGMWLGLSVVFVLEAALNLI